MRSHPLLPPVTSSTSSSHFFFPSPSEEHVYHPKPTLYNTATGGAIGAAFGTVVSAIKNATQQHDKGAIGVFTRTGSSITFFAALIGTYAAAEAITSNVRATEDPWNGGVGGCAAGFIAGIQRKSLPVAVGQCAFMGTVIGAYQTAGVDGLRPHARLTLSERQEEREKFFAKRRTMWDVLKDEEALKTAQAAGGEA